MPILIKNNDYIQFGGRVLLTITDSDSSSWSSSLNNKDYYPGDMIIWANDSTSIGSIWVDLVYGSIFLSTTSGNFGSGAQYNFIVKNSYKFVLLKPDITI